MIRRRQNSLFFGSRNNRRAQAARLRAHRSDQKWMAIHQDRQQRLSKWRRIFKPFMPLNMARFRAIWSAFTSFLAGLLTMGDFEVAHSRRVMSRAGMIRWGRSENGKGRRRKRTERAKAQVEAASGNTYESLEARQLLAGDLAGPQITDVIITSTLAEQPFLDAVDGTLNDGNDRGYVIPTDSNQLRAIPWENANQLLVVFNEDVGLSINPDGSDFSLEFTPEFLGANGSFDGGTFGALPTIVSATYDASTLTATLDFAAGDFFEATAVTLVVDSAGIQSDATGNDLDGEFVTGSGASESGDGFAGGDFEFEFITLPGEADGFVPAGGQRIVTAFDGFVVSDLQGEFVLDIGGGTNFASPEYDPFADFNADGFIDAFDGFTVSAEQGAFVLPFDVTAPTVTIEQAATQAEETNTLPIEFTVTFNEEVTGFDASDITLGGTAVLDNAMISVTEDTPGLVFTVSVNADSVITDGTLTASVNAGAALDDGNNASEASTSIDNEVVIDTTAPMVVITSDELDPAANSDFTLTFTFDEDVTGFDLADIMLSGGTAGAFTTVSGSEYTLVVTPPSDSTDDITIDIAADVAADTAGNGNAAAAQFVQAVDTVSPTVVITSDELDPAANGDFILTFVFSEDVTDFEASDVMLSGGMAGTFTAVSGSEYTLVVTPDSNSTADITVDVAAGAAADAAGNGNAAAQFIQAVDTVSPTVVITSDEMAPAANSDFTLTFTFDEDVTGFDLADIMLSGGTAGAFTAVSGSEYTLVVTPDSGSTADITVDIAADVAADTAGNGNAAAAQFVQAVDTVSPTVVITSDELDPAANGDFTLTFTFSEDVTDFEASDVMLSGGTAGAFTAVSGSEYTLVVTPDSDSTADITVDIAADVAADTAGNGNAAAAQFVQAVDTVSPTVVITSDELDPAANGDFTLTFTFSEDVTDFEASDVMLSGGMAGAFTAVSGSEYTLVVTPDSDSTADITVDVAADVAADTAGNGNAAAAQFVQAVDTVSPTVVITSDEMDPAANGDFILTFVFSEDVTDFEASDVMLSGGMAGTFTAVSGSEYTLVVTPDSNSTADITVDVAAGAAADAAGNGNAAAQFIQAVDTVSPTVVITSDEMAPAANSDFTLTFTFDEDVTGFDLADIMLSGGTAGAFTAVSGSEYTLVVTPDSDSTDDITVDIAADVAADTAGNGNAAAAQFVQAVDTVSPTVVITSDELDPAANSAFTLTFTFSEDVTDFEASDVMLSGGMAGAFTAVSGSEYTLVVTPDSDSTADITVDVAADVAADTAGNGNAAAVQFVQAVDTVSPTVVITSDELDPAANSAFTLTFTFSEDVTDFEASDVMLSGGMAGTFTAVSGSEYTLVVTPDSNSTADITVDIAAGAAMDAAGNGNTAADQFVQAVDTVAPAAPVIVSVAAGGTVSGTAEPNSTIIVTDEITDTVVGTTTADGLGDWTVTDLSGAFVFSAIAQDDAMNSSGNSNLQAALFATFEEDGAAESFDVTHDAFTISFLNNGSAGGQVSALPLGNDITFTPDPETFGDFTFTYSISDGTSGEGFVTVNEVNDPPVVNNVAANADEDGPAIPITGDFSDIDTMGLTFSFDDSMTSGMVVNNGDGTFSYDPDGQFEFLADGETATDTFTYTVDDLMNQVTATVTITITGQNDAPDAMDVEAVAFEDGPEITINADFEDVDLLDTHTFSVNASGTIGTVTNVDGVFTYNPNGQFESLAVGQTATDTFTYTVTDNNGASSTESVTITITGQNDAPVAMSDSITTDEQVPFSGTLVGSDVDNMDTLTFAAGGTSPANGSVVIMPDGSFTYTPDVDYFGPDSFSFTVQDAAGASSEAMISITVNPVDDIIIAFDQTVNAIEGGDDVVINALVDDFGDMDTLTFLITVPLTAGAGTVVNNNDGTFTYTPSDDFNGSATFTYLVSDGNGNSDFATVTINVAEQNDAPVAMDDMFTTDEDVAITGASVAGNDSDVDGDMLTFMLDTGPSNGTLVFNNDGTFEYTPDPDFNGVDNFTYMVSDGFGGTDTGMVAITVTPVNDAAVATNDTETTDEDTSVVISVLDNDSDVDMDMLTIVGFQAMSVEGGTIADNMDGTLTYTPAADFNGTDTFTYTISDGNGATATATVTVTVDPVNDAPIAVDDTANVDEDTSGTFDVLDNDMAGPTNESGQALSLFSLLVTPSGFAGAFSVNASNEIVFTPSAVPSLLNFNGDITVEYTVVDEGGLSDTGTLTLTVDPVNDDPTISGALSDSADEDDASFMIDLLDGANDVDTGDTLNVANVMGLPATGVTLSGNTLNVDPSDAAFQSLPDGQEEVITITFEITDGTVAIPQTATITITGTNDIPTVAGALMDAANEDDAAFTVDLLMGASDVDTGDVLNVANVTGLEPGVTLSGDTLNVDPADAAFQSLADGETQTITVEYDITDGEGGVEAQTATIVITGTNDDPTVASSIDDVNNATEDDANLVIPLSSVFDDIDDLDSLTLMVTANDNETLVTTSITGTDLTLDFQPNQSGSATITVTADDGKGGLVSDTFTVNVEPVNDQVVANDASLSVPEDNTLTFDLQTLVSDFETPVGDLLFTGVLSGDATGTLNITSDGQLTYSPSADFDGVATIEYTVTDDGDDTDTMTTSATGTITVTLTPINDAPVIAFPTDGVTAVEETQFDFTMGNAISIDDVDAAGSNLTLTLTPVNGTIATTSAVDLSMPITDTLANLNLILAGLSFTPGENVVGEDIASLTIDVNDNGATGASGAMSDTQTVSITVTNTNDPPTAVDDTGMTDQDSVLSGIDVLGNDMDVEGDTLTVVSFDDADTLGTVVVNMDGTFDYDPSGMFDDLADGAIATDSFTYTISDGNGGTSTAIVTITVAGLNDDPVANLDMDAGFTTDEESSFTTDNVLTNDTDIDGDTLSVTSFDTTSTIGTVMSNGDGTFNYDPNGMFEFLADGETATDSFTYTISDGNGGTSTATVEITINGVNDAPIGVADSYATVEDMPLSVPMATGVLANDSDPDTMDSLTALGVTPASNGTVVLSSDGSFTYTPDADFNGIDTFTYVVSDGTTTSDEVTVSITVTPLNDDPMAMDDSASGDEDSIISGDVSTNDSDVDGDTLTYALDGGASSGVAMVNSDGTFTYTPNADFNGSDSFTYTVSDGNGGTDTATVNITINPVNDGPVAVDDVASGDEDTVISGNVSTNDNDVDGDTLTFTELAGPSNGTLTLNTDGSFDYTPNADFNGSDSFTYTVSDGNGGTDTAMVNITVNPVNDAPVAMGDSGTIDEDGSITFDVADLGSDIDAGDMLTIDVAGALAASNGTVSVSMDGTQITYTPDPDFNGVDAFGFRISDGSLLSDEATIVVTVNPVNDGPVAVDDSVSGDEDTVISGDVSANDSDVDGDTLTFTELAGPSNGTLTLNTDGSFDYTPNADFNGSDSFTYTVSDGNGGTDTATVNITINPVNDNPVAMNDSASGDEDTVISGNVSTNDNDVDGDTLTFTELAGPSNGTLTLNSDGSFDYTPNADFNGSDSFTYTVSDGNGGTDTATVNITINPVNDDPVAVDDTFTVDEDNTLTEGVLGNDTDVDGDTLTVNTTPVSGPSNGTLTLNADGSFNYTPDANFNGMDSFEYEVSDGNGGMDTATVTITVNSVNDAPVANDGSGTTDEDVAFSGTLTASDPDNSVGELMFSESVAPTNGSVVINSDGTFTYTPNPDFNGSDTFTFLVDDGEGGSDTGTFTITVNPVNDAPIANDDSFTTDEDVPLAGTLTASDVDNVFADFTFAVGVTLPANGTVNVEPDGSFTYTPNSNFQGTDSFTFTVSDGSLTSAEATVTITVNNVDNDAPVAVDDSATTDEDTPVIISVLSNDSDFEMDTLSISAFDAMSLQGGTITDNGNGTLTYAPAANFNGSDSFTYTVSDGVNTTVATVSVMVTAVNDAPSFTLGGDQTVDEDSGAQSVSGFLTGASAGPADESGQTLSISVTNDNNGLFSSQPTIDLNTGDLTYTPADDANGMALVTVTVMDDGGGANTTTQTFMINVTAVNDAPSFTLGGDQTVDEDSGAQSVSGFLTGASAGPADESGQTLSISVTNDNNGLFSSQPTIDLNTGDLTYTPADDANGMALVTVTVMDDGGGANTTTQTFMINVTAVNDAPSFTLGGDQTVDEDSGAQSVSGFLTGASAGPADESGQTLSISVTNDNNGLFSSQPTIDLNTGDLTYTPADDANGMALVTVTVMDDGGGANTTTQTFMINVTAVNDAPSFTLGGDQTVDEDSGAQSVSGFLTGASAGPADESGQTLSISVTNDNNGLFSSQPTIDLNTGDLTYTPADDANGMALVTVTVMDDGGGANTTTQTFMINVTAVNDAPSFTLGGDQTVDEDSGAQSVSGFLTGASAGPADESGQTLSISVTNDNNGLFSSQPTIDLNTGDLTYTPADDANGMALVTVTVMDDGGGANTTTQTFMINVTAVNDAPSFTLGGDQTVDEDSGAQSVSGFLTGASAGPADESGQTLSISVTNDNNGLFSSQPTIDLNTGDLTYTPADDANGMALVTVTVMDDGGGANTTTQTFMINVTAVNDAPSFTLGGDQTVDEDSGAQSVSGFLTGASAGPADESGQTLSISVTNDNNGLFSSQPTIDLNTGDLTYTPADDANGMALVTVTVMDDGGGANTTTQTFMINVTAVNDAPVAADDGPFATFVDTPALVLGTTLLSNDTDVDGDTLTIVGVSADAGATAMIVGSNVVVTPAMGSTDLITVTYTVDDGSGELNSTDTAVFSVNVVPLLTGGGGEGGDKTAANLTGLVSGDAGDQSGDDRSSNVGFDLQQVIEVDGPQLTGSEAIQLDVGESQQREEIGSKKSANEDNVNVNLIDDVFASVDFE